MEDKLSTPKDKLSESSGPLKVVAAAILLEGRIWTLEPPARHHHVIDHMFKEKAFTKFLPATAEQGFLLSDGRFARRKPSKWIALNAGQVKNGKTISSDLTTEDLW